MAAEIPKWEAELWSYVSSGNGEHCPLRSQCETKPACGWCPDDNRERLNQFLEQDEVTLPSSDFIETNIDGQTGRLFLLVELLAQKYLQAGKVKCPPVSTALIGSIVQGGITEVRHLPLKAYHGAIWHPKAEWIVQLKADDTPAMKRFTLFHEAFHILAHCRCTPVFKKRGLEQGSFNELLADYFATCLLMPRRWVREKWAEVKDLGGMAEIFDVPKSAVCIRLRQLGLV
jgi:hypothetical protein